jgi:hypothetical protein
MTRYWGDDSWEGQLYMAPAQLSLFDEAELEKQGNPVVAEAFRRRLQDVAGFQYVPEPLPMRNSKGSVVYYLFFAAQKPVAAGIVDEIFETYRC